MQLERLTLTNFKNYAAQRVDCSPIVNGFVGLNGMGKTNLLDAIYYLCMGKSHFNLPDTQLMLHDTGFFRLEGHFRLHQKPEKIVAKVALRRPKELERNDVPYPRLSDHVGLLPVVFIAPDDTFIIHEGSEGRRRFLDNTLSQLDRHYLQQLILYNHVLRQRNAALKQWASSPGFQPDLLEVYDEQLVEPAAYLYERRSAFMEEFRPILRATVSVLSGAREDVDCQYQSQLAVQPMGELLRESAGRDRALERTTAGVHRDELVFLLDGYPLKKFGSQGQLKSYLLALKLAQYELLRRKKGVAPLLLLDDLFDKLDRQRVEHLLGLLLEGAFGQIFITDTHESRLAEIVRQLGAEHRIFSVENGTVG